MNEIFNYSQLMAEPQVKTCKEKKLGNRKSKEKGISSEDLKMGILQQKI